MSGRFARLRSSRNLAIATVVVAVFVDMFIYGIIIPILPEILGCRLRVSPSDIQFWLSVQLAVYNTAVILCAPIFGFIADRLPNKKSFMLGGLIMLALSTVAFAVAPTIAWLLVARTFQGMSAGVVWSVGLAILVEAVGPQDVGLAMGWVSLAISLGAISGPFVGALAYDNVGHYGTFAIASVFIVLDMILRLLFVQPEVTVYKSSINESQARAGSQDSVTTTEIRHATPSRNDTDEETGLLNKIQHATATVSDIPVMFQLLTSSEVLFSLWCIFAVSFVQIGFEAILPLHIETAFSWSTQGAGFMFLILLVPVLFGPLVGRIYDRIGYLSLTTAGIIAITVGSGALSSVHNSSTRDVLLFGISLFIMGAGITLVLTPTMAEVSAFAEVKERNTPGCFGSGGATAQCCALISICIAFSGIVGPSVTGTIQTISGWTATCLTCCAIAITPLALLIAFKAHR